MFKIISCIALAVAVACTQGCGQESNRAGSVKDQNMLATNECFSKGGLGIVNTKLHIDLKSAQNELLLIGLDRWVGQDATTPEVAIVFENRVWSPQSLPEGFDMSKAIVVSFEGSKV